MAKLIVKDGEGSTKFIEAEVISAASLTDARTAARAVVSSNMLKCEVFGSALKSSTISCILGYINADINIGNYDIFICSEKDKAQIVNAALEINYDKSLMDLILSGGFIKIIIDLKMGECRATAWGCDLTYEYVKKNGCIE